MLSGPRSRLRRAGSGRRGRPRPRRVAALVAVVALAVFGASAALGYWSGGVSGGGGLGTAGATTVSAGATPTVYEAGATQVVVTWGPSSLSDGTPVAGYVVRRYAEATGTLATIGAGCAGTITALTCTESATPVGDWQYTVTPVFATNWRGLESPKSGSVDTAPGTMTIQRTLFGGTVAPLPATVTGTISGFAASDPLSYTLDGSVPLTASPANAGSLGTASFSLVIPAATSDGPHTVTIQGSLVEASVGIVVDTTAPTINAFTTPAPNAAGWNVTSPVEVSGTVDDANGSGVSYARYTTDGSDPRTSPTAQTPTGPVSVAATTTLKYYVVDLTGNQSPVQTMAVKIDTTVPVFTVAFVNAQGGVYRKPIDPITHVPGQAYYRGSAAGSFRFQLTPVPVGGSPAVSAGFSALPADAVGFSFDSSSVTTPLGGPFVSNPMSWAAGTASNPSGTIDLTNQAGSTFGAVGTILNDSAAPSGGAVDATGLTGTGGRYSTTLSLSLSLAKGADTGSGLADGTGQTDIQAQLLRASATLSSSDGIVNGSCGTYSAYAQVGGLDPASTVTDTVPTDRSCYRYEYLVADHVGNVATYTSPDIKAIATPAASVTPTAATLTPVSGIASESVSGSSVYYNPAQLGSFSVDTSTSAPHVGIAQVSFPAIAGFTGGGVVSQPLTGTTFRSTYAWSANGPSPSPGPQPLTATNNAGNSATNANAFSVLADGTGPAGGSVDAIGLGGTGGRYSTSLTLSLGLARGADGGSGLAATGARLLRASASLSSSGTTNGVCGSYGPYNQVGVSDPGTPVSDTVPVDRICYRYAYLVADKVGNQTTYTSPDIKVDAALPPAPALTFSALSGAYWSGFGTTVYYLPAGSGGFRVTATSADVTSGTTGFGFPTLPAGWTGTSGGSGILNYAWGPGAPTAPSGAQSVTTSNNAGASAAASFSAVPDGAAPTGGSVSYTNGVVASTSASVTIVAATDTGSGLAPGGALLQRAAAPVSAGSCGTFTAFATIATSPTSPYTDAVATATCYEYRYLVSDNLGNQATFTNAGVLKVDTSGPTHAISLADGAVGAYLTGSTLFYASGTAGSFKLVDTLTGTVPPASATYPLLGVAGWTHAAEIVSTPSGGPYTSSTFSWTANPSSPSAYAVSAQNTLGTASTSTLTFTGDPSAPSGGTVDATGLTGAGSRYSTSLTLHVAVAPGTDGGSGVAASGLLLLRATASLGSNTGAAPGVCGTYGAFAQVGASDPTSPVTDTVTTTNKCYRYEYLVPDRVGNVATYTSPDVKVETTAPVSLTPTNATITPVTGAASQLVIGSTVYYDAAQSGSFNVESIASDATSGIGLVAFPVLAGFGGGGSVTTPTSGTTFRSAYSWSNNGASPSPGPQSLTATDGAGLAATTKTGAFTVLADPGPTGGSVDAFSLGGTGGRWSTTLSLNGPLTKGTSPVGLATTGAQLLQATAPLTTNGSGACGTYTAFVLVAVDPPSPQAATVPTDHACYRYEYVVTDTLGVTAVYASGDIKVDTTPPPAPTLTFSGFSQSYWTGSTLYFRKNGPSAFTVAASASDSYAGIASYAFPTFAAWSGSAGSLGVETYSAASPTLTIGDQHVTATNNAGSVSANSILKALPDGTPPAGGSSSISNRPARVPSRSPSARHRRRVRTEPGHRPTRARLSVDLRRRLPRVIRSLHDDRHSPGLAIYGLHRGQGQLLRVRVRRLGQRRQLVHLVGDRRALIPDARRPPPGGPHTTPGAVSARSRASAAPRRPRPCACGRAACPSRCGCGCGRSPRRPSARRRSAYR